MGHFEHLQLPHFGSIRTPRFSSWKNISSGVITAAFTAKHFVQKFGLATVSVDGEALTLNNDGSNHEAGAVHKGGRWGVSMSTRGAKVFSTPEQIFGTWVKDVIFPQFVN